MQKVLMILSIIILGNCTHAQKVRIIENSKIARLAAKLKKEEKYALTLGKTIFITCTKEEFFADPWWVKHELTHVRQFKKHGMLNFLGLYFFYSLFHDYRNIPFEKEAIAAEFSDD